MRLNNPEDLEDLRKQIIGKLLYIDSLIGKKITYEKDVPFYARQIFLDRQLQVLNKNDYS